MQLTQTLIDKASGMCGSGAKLADRLGVSRQLITDWRKGKAMPTEVQVGQMALITGIRIEDALQARNEEVLEKTPEGREVLRVMRMGFLRGAAAALFIFATLPGYELCQRILDKIYIVSNKASTLVCRHQIHLVRLLRTLVSNTLFIMTRGLELGRA